MNYEKEKTTFQTKDLRKRLNRALKKKQELNNRIMKAIEYIKDKYYDRFLEDGLEEQLSDNGLKDRKQIMYILEILKGEDKE